MSKMRKTFSGLLSRTKSTASPNVVDLSNAPADSPEANIAKALHEFCNSTDNEAEVVHLPVIVDSAESSATAAAAAAQEIRKLLGKEYSHQPHTQTKAVMLTRILSDNPGPLFTRNFDKTFVDAVKNCLRNCKDSTTQQLLRETLDSIEFNKGYDETVQPLITMWKKEKGANFSYAAIPRPQPPGVWQHGNDATMHGANGTQRSGRQLPPPEELASRIEEAKNTAKILLQLIQTTPSDQVLGNDLLREFGERAHMAIRSMQNYINSTAPAPDDDTMQTLIETTEQLSLASSRYQRTMLTARRAAGLSSPPPGQGENGPFTPPIEQPPVSASQNNGAFGASEPAPTRQYPSPTGPPPTQTEPQTTLSATGAPLLPPVNPFADPDPEEHHTTAVPQTSQSFSIVPEPTYAGTGSAPVDSNQHEDPYSSSPVRTKFHSLLTSAPQHGASEIDSHSGVERSDRPVSSQYTDSAPPSATTYTPVEQKTRRY